MNNKLDVVRVKLVTDQQLLSDTAIGSPKDATKLVAKYLSGFDREVFCALNLNAKGQPINMNIISIGELTSTLVHPREVFKGSILSNAAGVIFFHNHPSGDPTPSPEDFKTTKMVEEAGNLLRVKVLDHIVVGSGTNKYYGIISTERGSFIEDQKSEVFSSEDILVAAERESFQCEWEKMENNEKEHAEHTTDIKLHEAFIKKDIDGPYGKFNTVTLPKGTFVSGKDLSGYQFHPKEISGASPSGFCSIRLSSSKDLVLSKRIKSPDKAWETQKWSVTPDELKKSLRERYNRYLEQKESGMLSIIENAAQNRPEKSPLDEMNRASKEMER